MWMQIGSGIPLGTANIPAAYRYTMNNYFANACGNTDSGEIEYLKPNLQIFPNPTSGILEINCDFNLNDYYQILDYQGRVFFFSSMNTTKMTIDLSSLDPGFYFLTFNRIRETFPIVKQ